MYINDLTSDEDLFQGMILEIDCNYDDDDEADEDFFPDGKNSKQKPKKQTQKQTQKQTKKQAQKQRREKAKKANNKPKALGNNTKTDLIII